MNRDGSKLLATIRKDREERLKKQKQTMVSSNSKGVRCNNKSSAESKPRKQEHVDRIHILNSAATIRLALKGFQSTTKGNTAATTSSSAVGIKSKTVINEKFKTLPLSPSNDRVLTVTPRHHSQNGLRCENNGVPTATSFLDLGYVLANARLDGDGYAVPPPPPLSDFNVDNSTSQTDDEVQISEQRNVCKNTKSYLDGMKSENMVEDWEVPVTHSSASAAMPIPTTVHCPIPFLIRGKSMGSLSSQSVASTLTSTTTKSYATNSLFGTAQTRRKNYTIDMHAVECLSSTSTSSKRRSLSNSTSGPSEVENKISSPSSEVSPFNPRIISKTSKYSASVHPRQMTVAATDCNIHRESNDLSVEPSVKLSQGAPGLIASGTEGENEIPPPPPIPTTTLQSPAVVSPPISAVKTQPRKPRRAPPKPPCF